MENNIKKALSLVGIVVGVTVIMGIAVYFLYSQVDYLDLVGKKIVISQEDDNLLLVDENEKTVFSYSVSEWQGQVSGRWNDLFPEPIMVNDTEIGPERFERFTVASPVTDPRKMIFAVSTYLMPEDISLFFVLDVRNRELSFVGEENRGVIGDIKWSPKGTHFAYFLNTQRAAGDYLTLDSIETMEKEFILEEEDILLALGMLEEELESIEFTPEFRSLGWTEDGERLTFVSDTLEEDEEARWSINIDGTEIVRTN